MKSIIAWFANNHVAANLLMALIVLAGLVSLPRMPMKSLATTNSPKSGRHVRARWKK